MAASRNASVPSYILQKLRPDMLQEEEESDLEQEQPAHNPDANHAETGVHSDDEGDGDDREEESDQEEDASGDGPLVQETINLLGEDDEDTDGVEVVEARDIVLAPLEIPKRKDKHRFCFLCDGVAAQVEGRRINIYAELKKVYLALMKKRKLDENLVADLAEIYNKVRPDIRVPRGNNEPDLVSPVWETDVIAEHVNGFHEPASAPRIRRTIMETCLAAMENISQRIVTPNGMLDDRQSMQFDRWAKLALQTQKTVSASDDNFAANADGMAKKRRLGP